MKRISLFLALVTFFASCKKDDIEQLPKVATLSVKIDTSYHNQSAMPPKTKFLLSRFTETPSGNVKVTAVKVFLKGMTAAMLGKIRNMYVSVMIDGSLYESPKVIPTTDTTFFPNAEQYLNAGKSYRVEVYADIDASLRAQLTPYIQISYLPQTGNAWEYNSVVVPGQTLYFATGTMQYALSPSNPDAALVAANQEVETLRFTAEAAGLASTIMLVQVSVANPSLVQSVKIYSGSAQIGSTSTFNAGVATVPLSELVSDGDADSLSIRLQLKPFANASLDGLSAKTSVVQIKYKTNGEDKTFTNTIAGNDLYAYKTTLSVSSTILPGTLQNNVRKDLAQLNIKASSSGAGAVKQVTFDFGLIDNGTHTDTLSVTELGLRVGSTVATNVRFTNDAGAQIDSITPSTGKVFVTFVSGAAEMVIPAGSTVQVTVIGKAKGYLHPSDGDVLSIIPVIADAQTASKYVNSGVAPDNLNAKLHTGPAASASAVRQYFIWSGMSDPAHSFAFGAGTPDATNGFLVSTDLLKQTWVQ